MIASTLNWYIARIFIRNTLIIYVFFLFLIFSVDTLELSRSLSSKVEGSMMDVMAISALRVPEFVQRVLPFSVLFGATLSLVMLSRSLELVVARASGVSVWQFLKPLAISGIVIGLITSLLYQPIALEAQRASQALEADTFGRLKGNYANKSNNFWLRAGQKNGDIIIRAAITQDNGRDLAALTVYKFSVDGKPLDRIDAERAKFQEVGLNENYYVLTNAVVTTPGALGRTEKTLKVPINVSAQDLLLSATQATQVPFWKLGEHAEKARISGRNHLSFLVQRQAHLALPFLFIAMIVIAACMSLTFARFGISGKLILAGILAGFVLYVLSQIVLTFGSNGLVSPFMAAWSPASVAILVGVTILLYQEDG